MLISTMRFVRIEDSLAFLGISVSVTLELQAPKLCSYQNAGLAELVDALDLGSSIARCESSSLSPRTI